MAFVNEIEDHPQVTQRRGLRYQFIPKHHGCDRKAACWLQSITCEEEFAVFDLADLRDISDEDLRLYGAKPTEDRKHLCKIGTYGEQLAEFPAQRDQEPWHGYPVYPIDESGPDNRQGDKCKPAKEVFDKLYWAGVIDEQQKKRLKRGNYA